MVELLNVGDNVIFLPKVYQNPYAPYYDRYMGHTFKIDHLHPDRSEHYWLTCVDDPSVLVDGYIDHDCIQLYTEQV
jgi:hypothetical protein